MGHNAAQARCGDAPSPPSVRCEQLWSGCTPGRGKGSLNRMFQPQAGNVLRSGNKVVGAHVRAPLRSAVRPGTGEGI